MDAGIGNVRNLAEGGDHRLLLVVHGVVAGADEHGRNQHNYRNGCDSSQLSEVGRFLGGLAGCPAVGSILFHVEYSFIYIVGLWIDPGK